MVMQRTITGTMEPARPWPPEQVQAAHGDGVYEITWTQRTSVIVSADSRDEARKAARDFDPDFYYGDVEIEVYKLSRGDSAEYRVERGQIIHEEHSCAVDEITPEMIREEIERRARDEYSHLTDLHAERCALRDIEQEIADREWPSREWWRP